MKRPRLSADQIEIIADALDCYWTEGGPRVFGCIGTEAEVEALELRFRRLMGEE